MATPTKIESAARLGVLTITTREDDILNDDVEVAYHRIGGGSSLFYREDLVAGLLKAFPELTLKNKEV